MKTWLCIPILLALMGSASAQTDKVENTAYVEVTNLSQGMSVPTVFHVRGNTLPRAIVQVTAVSSLRQNQFGKAPERGMVMESAQADDQGHFDLKLDVARMRDPNLLVKVLVQATATTGLTGPVNSFDVSVR